MPVTLSACFQQPTWQATKNKRFLLSRRGAEVSSQDLRQYMIFCKLQVNHSLSQLAYKLLLSFDLVACSPLNQDVPVNTCWIPGIFGMPFLAHDVWRPLPHCVYLLASTCVLCLLTLVLLQSILQYIYDAAYKRFAKSSGKGSLSIQAQYPRPLYVPRGRKHCKRMASLYKHQKHSRGHISYLKVKIKIPLIQNSSFCSFCMHI